MVASAGVNAVKSGVAKVTSMADANIDAAAARHPSGHKREAVSSAPPTDATPSPKSGTDGGSPSTKPVPTSGKGN
jgi:hypothetical protein